MKFLSRTLIILGTALIGLSPVFFAEASVRELNYNPPAIEFEKPLSPEFYSTKQGKDVRYFSEKYGVMFVNEKHIYKWQWEQLSESQQGEAFALVNQSKAAVADGKYVEFYDSLSEAQRAMIYCYSRRNYIMPTDLIVSTVEKPDGIYAAVHELVTPVEKATTIVGYDSDGNTYKLQRPLYADGKATITEWITEAQVSENLSALQSQYPSGTTWSYEEGGCNFFATDISNALFGQVAFDGFVGTPHRDLSQIRVGDVVYHETNSGLGFHIAVVWKVEKDAIVLVEGNVDSGESTRVVSWERKMSFKELTKGYFVIYTFYAPIYQPSS